MAIDDVSIYTLTGEEISRTSILNEMINFYGLLLEAGQTKITDFNEGSEIRDLLEAFAVLGYIIIENKNELTSIGFIDSADGEFLDKHGANPFIDLPRDMGSEANGTVTFTIPTALTSEAVIPEGTIVVNSSTGLEYSTMNDIVFDTESTSVTVAVECLTAGEEGNCEIGEIDTIDEIITDIPELTVSNESKITGGTDYEEDEEYRERLLAYKRRDDFGSLPYYLDLGESVEGVHDIILVDDEHYTSKVLVNGYTKPTSSEVLSDVLEVYTDINNHIHNQSFTVGTPDYIIVDMSVDLSVNTEISSDTVETLIKDFIDGTNNLNMLGFEFNGLYMGSNLTSEMIESNLNLLDEVETSVVRLSIDNIETDPVTCAVDEVVQVGTITVNQTLVE